MSNPTSPSNSIPQKLHGSDYVKKKVFRVPEAYYTPRHLITMFFGPMFAGKTQELISRLSRHEAVGQRVLLVSSSKDNRISTGEAVSAGVVSTHRKNSSKLENSTEICVLSIEEIESMIDNEGRSIIDNHTVIGIDEGQFFPDLEILINWAVYRHKIIYVAGLFSTSEGTIFGNMYKLIPFSKLVQLNAVCELCYSQHGVIVDATMTLCTTKKDTDELVGTSSYIPVCLQHWKTQNSDSPCLSPELSISDGYIKLPEYQTPISGGYKQQTPISGSYKLSEYQNPISGSYKRKRSNINEGISKK